MATTSATTAGDLRQIRWCVVIIVVPGSLHNQQQQQQQQHCMVCVRHIVLAVVVIVLGVVLEIAVGSTLLSVRVQQVRVQLFWIRV